MGTLRRAETAVWAWFLGGPTLSELCRCQVKMARLGVGDQMPLINLSLLCLR